MYIKSKNKITIDLIIDLHGMNLDEAFDILKNNINLKSKVRNILLITGKSGILHNLVPRWLNYNTGIFSNIQSIKNAPQTMGGSGAFIVTLKKLIH